MHQVAEFKLITDEPISNAIDNTMEKARKIENRAKGIVNNLIRTMESDIEYLCALADLRMSKTPEDKQNATERLNIIRQDVYGLTSYGIEKILKDIKHKEFADSINADIVAKLSVRIYQSVKKRIFEHCDIHFLKYGEFNTLETKANKCGILFKPNEQVVIFNTHKKQVRKKKVKNKDGSYKTSNKKKKTVKYEIPVKIRENDTFNKELLKHKICYCRIVRKPGKNKYEYYLQVVVDVKDKPVLKLPKQQKGTVGIDLGPSSVAVVSKNDAILESLAPQADKCNKDIIRLSRQLERLRRLNNPNNYNEDGTIKTPPKGEKLYWYRSKHYIRVLFQLKNVYRKKSAITKQSHNILANKIISMGQRFFIEELDIKSWQKKSTKPSAPSTKLITVIDKKTKKEKQVYKYVRKKRFGKSINNHSPGLLIQLIKQKLLYYDQMLEYVNTIKYKASQYDHTTGEYIKPNLKDRVKTVGTHKVQRDLYSAFLIKNNKDSETVDQLRCNKEFNNFLNLNNIIMNNLKVRYQQGEIFPSCMAVNEF